MDVNPEHEIYLALDFVGTSPMTFSATVARLNKTSSVLNAPGILSSDKSEERIKEESFGYVEAIPGRISPNGRYVSADGSMSCGPNAYPGVWDLLSKKNVINEKGCDALFEKKSASAIGPN